jgi:hypothetical protein
MFNAIGRIGQSGSDGCGPSVGRLVQVRNGSKLSVRVIINRLHLPCLDLQTGLKPKVDDDTQLQK